MAEAAHKLAEHPRLRVAVHGSTPLRQKALTGLLRELGHEAADSAAANVVLADGDVYSFDDTAAVVLGVSDAGAAGRLPANASAEQIDAALRAVAAGLTVRTPASPRFAALDESEIPSPLTPREIEILIALSDGLSNKQVARRFDISQHTVKFHVESIFRKLGAATRAEAVAKGLRRGIVHL